METKGKKIRRVAVLFAAFTLLAILMLGIHLYIVSDAPRPQIQISRIDFQEPVDSVSVNRIKGTILAFNGVKHVYFNVPDHVVVFGHDPSVVPAETVVRKVQEKFAFKAERFLPDPETISKGCPITGKNSIFVKMGAYLRRIL